jgi:hypothetical protein
VGKTLIKLKTENVTKKFYEMIGWRGRLGSLVAPSIKHLVALLIKRGNSGKEEA